MTLNIADDDDQALIKLSEYPLLAALANKQTTATRLDGRACRHLYVKATIDTATVSADELELICAMDVQVFCVTANLTGAHL